jgi:hypothetical protein
LIAAVQNMALLCGGIGAAVGAKRPNGPKNRAAAAVAPRSYAQSGLRRSNQKPDTQRGNLLWAA